MKQTIRVFAFVAGLVVFVIFIAAVGAAWARIYNRFAQGAFA